jgi:hypothetical protein
MKKNNGIIATALILTLGTIQWVLVATTGMIMIIVSIHLDMPGNELYLVEGWEMLRLIPLFGCWLGALVAMISVRELRILWSC